MASANCFFCGCELRHGRGDRRRRYSKDHLTPRSRGGASDHSNTVPACVSCNLDKGNLTLPEYRLIVTFRSGKLRFRSKSLHRFYGETQK